ncbi:S-adenosyl-L-methionine-dependent methyltransferase [Amylostereum chailletii]|nr:S-adenosyl-L-methionine-dependent methyltransferase [Amylostereum chailletii]
MVNVHQIAQVGFGQGTNELYDRARPSYQSSALSHIRKAVAKPNSLNIVEIGSGTGIFTRALLAHPEWTSSIGALTAVEPSAGMREVFAKSISDQRVSVREGAFDRTGEPDGQVDLIVIAQAFHWCPDYAAAAEEFDRILKPDGIVVLIWNLEDREAAKWVAQLRDRIEQHEHGTPQFRLGLWRQLFETTAYQDHFSPPEEETWSYSLDGSLKIVTDRAFSKSYIAIQPDEVKANIKDDIQSIVERGEGRRWIDEAADIFEYPYKTYTVIIKRK